VISARNAWAVGSSGRGTLIVHWNGTAWQRVSSPAVRRTAGLFDVSGTSARNVWAVGATDGLVFVSDGVTRPAAHAAAARLTAESLTAESLTAARVTAATVNSEPLMMHWNGKTWRRMSVPVPVHGGQLLGVQVTSSRSAWAVGCTRFFAARKAKPLALRWNGTAWN
jgi:hypothetical protein